jgi:lipopolysaccharide export system protein LptA
MTTRVLSPFALLAAAIALAGVSLPAHAAPPTPSGPPNALQGFSQNRDQPVKIESATLEVRDKDKVATFGGNVHLVQGDTTLRCKTLVVYYEPNNTPGAIKAERPGPGGQQQIRRLEAKGGVIVTQKDQTATGDNGVFDMKSNTVTLLGNVVVTQGQNILKGDRLVVNLTTGVSNVECGHSSQCRVQALIQPNSSPQFGRGTDPGARGSEPGGAKEPKEPSRPRQLHPTGVLSDGGGR